MGPHHRRRRPVMRRSRDYFAFFGAFAFLSDFGAGFLHAIEPYLPFTRALAREDHGRDCSASGSTPERRFSGGPEPGGVERPQPGSKTAPQ